MAHMQPLADYNVLFHPNKREMTMKQDDENDTDKYTADTLSDTGIL